MPDNAEPQAKGNSTLLYLGLAGIGVYLWMQHQGGTTPTRPASADAPAPDTGTPASPAVTTPASQPAGFPMDGEPNIVFATASARASCDNANQIFDRQWGDGSRNVRIEAYRAVGNLYHIFVEDLIKLEHLLYNQGGRSWDDVHYYFRNDPSRTAALITSYNQQNPQDTIVRRW